MEPTIEQYQKCIKQLLSYYEKFKSKDSHIELVFDDERHRYLAVWVGWENQKRIHQCAVHIDICEDTVVIQWNDTEDLIDTELINMGIPPGKIRLGLLPAEV